MNETNKTKKLRFNIVDVLIIIGIAAAVIFCVGLLSGSFLAGKIVSVSYCVKIDGVDEKTATVLEKGMQVYSTDENIPIGVVKSAETKPLTITSYDHTTNRFVTANQEGIYTMYLHINAGCIFEDGCYMKENIRISENTSLDINLPFQYTKAEIISVTPEKASEEN